MIIVWQQIIKTRKIKTKIHKHFQIRLTVITSSYGRTCTSVCVWGLSDASSGPILCYTSENDYKIIFMSLRIRHIIVTTADQSCSAYLTSRSYLLRFIQYLLLVMDFLFEGSVWLYGLGCFLKMHIWLCISGICNLVLKAGLCSTGLVNTLIQSIFLPSFLLWFEVFMVLVFRDECIAKGWLHDEHLL